MYGFTMNNRFCTNIFYRRHSPGHVYRFRDEKGGHPIDRSIGQCDNNLFFSVAGGQFTVEEWICETAKTLTFCQWQDRGFDVHSVHADPLFVDAENGDYRLKPRSPALKLGFQQIDVSRIGIREQ